MRRAAARQGVGMGVRDYEIRRHALFFTDAGARALYRQNARQALLRRNTVNGRLYRDDPTIMAWGLLNEPRCEAWKARPRPGRRGRSPRPARRRPHDAPAGSCPGRGLGALQLPRRHGVESVQRPVLQDPASRRAADIFPHRPIHGRRCSQLHALAAHARRALGARARLQRLQHERRAANAGARQVPECPEHVQAWVAEMAAFVKRIDPNHLVTIGEEGFFAAERPEVRKPGAV